MTNQITNFDCSVTFKYLDQYFYFFRSDVLGTETRDTSYILKPELLEVVIMTICI